MLLGDDRAWRVGLLLVAPAYLFILVVFARTGPAPPKPHRKEPDEESG